MPETYINPSPEQIEALAQLELDGPIFMLNLLRFKPDGGEQQYREYGAAAMPFLQKAGASIRYIGNGVTTVIGGEDWDEIVIVEYPTRQAFLEMIGNPDYPMEVRDGSLLDSRLYCSLEGSPAF